MTMNNDLFFGCFGLEYLIDQDKLAYGVCRKSHGQDPVCKGFVSCIVGPDGVGKSILGLSAASCYAAISPSRHVIYASTDLNFDQAETTWDHFGLATPGIRLKELHDKIDKHTLPEGNTVASERIRNLGGNRDKSDAKKVDFEWIAPFDEVANEPDDLHPYSRLFEPQGDSDHRVSFLDLAAYSAGDDWGLLNRTLGLLQNSSSRSDSPHLMVVDAVEGLEAMVGERDGFGLERSRRSRLAQMVRIARDVNCSIIFIVEQKSEKKRLDEVFVSDLVIRLRSRQRGGYLQKTAEIEKARGKAHIRGEHEYQIRSGKDGNTPDDPSLDFGYFQILPSLNVKQFESTDSGEKFTLPARMFPEALDDINRLLSRDPQLKKTESSDPRDRILVLVADSRTHKSRLGFSFLAEGLKDGDDATDLDGGRPGAILLTTEGSTSSQLKNAIKDWNGEQDVSDEQILVREILPTFLSSSELLFQVKTNIRAMKARLGLGSAQAQNLRVVIDNWTGIIEAHKSLEDDPQILQRVFRTLQEEGVLATIISTQAGSPNAKPSLFHEQSIMRLEARRLHVWPVDFYGQRRLAITSSLSGRYDPNSFVFELRQKEDYRYRIETSKDFHVYRDLETGHAKPIELKVKLYSGYHEDEGNRSTYMHEVASLFGDLYSGQEVVSFEYIERYSGFRDYIRNLHRSKLDHTLVFQVDEYWNADNSELAELTPEPDSTEKTETENGNTSNSNSAQNSDGANNRTFRLPLHKDFGILLLHEQSWEDARNVVIPKWFRTPHGHADSEKNGQSQPIFLHQGLLYDENSAMPKYAEFDEFTMADIRALAEDISKLNFQSVGESPQLTVGDVFDALSLSQNNNPSDNKLMPTQISWAVFLDACQVVAQNSGKLPFEVDMRTTETLNCLMLEVWFSRMKSGLLQECLKEKFQSNTGAPQNHKENVNNFIGLWKHASNPGQSNSPTSLDFPASLNKLLENPWFRQSLVDSVAVVAGCLPSNYKQGVLANAKPNPNSVAIRTWYTTAVLTQNEHDGFVPAKLPGSFAVRGDWFLGVAAGSRSLELATRAINNLTTYSMNLKRLRLGVGLPVQSFSNLDLVETALTRPTRYAEERLNLRQLLSIEPKVNIKPEPNDNNEEQPQKVENADSGNSGNAIYNMQDGSARNSTFEPIFRSKIEHYVYQCEEFGRLIAYLLAKWPPDRMYEELVGDDKFDNFINDIVEQCKQVAKCAEIHSPKHD